VNRDLRPLESALRKQVQQEEKAADQDIRDADSLWDHLKRTAKIAEKLGRTEGLDPETCRLAALFHDAGKFHQGQLHGDQTPEEVHSVAVLKSMAQQHGIAKTQIDEISEAILQLYRDDPEPTLLAEVLFDADNLDKLGFLGVANFFVKRGLKGRGISPSFMVKFTIELTYARHAEGCMQSASGKTWARRRAPQTRNFFISLIEQLREDGLADLVINEIEFEGLIIDAVVPAACSCGRALSPEIWQEHGIKCHRIHLVHACEDCNERYEVRFCRPRMADTADDPGGQS
jgi:putative nucleotidyltransferase with HDIG domain